MGVGTIRFGSVIRVECVVCAISIASCIYIVTAAAQAALLLQEISTKEVIKRTPLISEYAEQEGIHCAG